MESHLFEISTSIEAWLRGIDSEQGNPFGTQIWVCLGCEHQYITVLAIGNERLLTIDAVIIAILDGGSANPLEITACTRLAHANGTNRLARNHFGQPGLSLLLGTQI